NFHGAVGWVSRRRALNPSYRFLLPLFRPRLGRAGRGGRRIRGGVRGSLRSAIPVAGLRQPRTHGGDFAEIEQRLVRGVVMVEHADVNLPVIRERANEGNR